jgi:hypothetical protein
LRKFFITGEVLLADKPGECLKDAKITLTTADGTGSPAKTVTDFWVILSLGDSKGTGRIL